jgi:exonuclease SbcC
MQLLRLRLRNFRQHADTEIELGPGLTGIVGANGAGKTTLLEAIAWALYGMPAARGTKESIRRRSAGDRARVEVHLTFSLGANRYRVKRTLADATLHLEGTEEPIATTLAGVTERLTRLLGMTREEFFNTYFTNQKELAVMAAKSAPERAQFLSRVLGYERLRVGQDRLREERAGLRARLAGLEEGLPDASALEQEAATAAADLAAATEALERARADRERAALALSVITPHWEGLQQLQERVRSASSDLRIAEKDVDQARQAMAQLDHALAEAMAASTRLGELAPALAPLEALHAERQQLDEAARQVASRRQAMGQAAEIRRGLENLERRLADLPPPERVAAARADLEAQRAVLAERVPTARELRTAWVRDAQDATTRRQQLLDQFNDLRAQRDRLVALGPGGACPTCQRVLGEEYATVLGVVERQLAEVETNGRYFRQRMEQLKKEPPEVAAAEAERLALEAAVERLTAEVSALETQSRERETLERRRSEQRTRLAELEGATAGEMAAYDEARHEAVRRTIAELEPLFREAARIATVAERMPQLAARMAEAEQALTRAEAAASRLREELGGMGWSDAAFREAGAQFAAATEALRERDLALARAEAALAGARQAEVALGRRREERERRVAAIALTRRELAMNQELDRAFTDLRTDLNATLRPDLSEVASGFLRDLTSGRYSDLELDEDYVATIVDDGESKPVISGGEEDVVSLALRLAISQMIAERAGQPLSLLVLDEIFGSLDEERRAAVLELLRNLADRFPQVVLITHIDSVRDGFDRVIRVRYDVERGLAEAREEPLPGDHDAAA